MKRSTPISQHDLDEAAKQINPDTMKNVQDIVNHYSGKSDHELINELKGFKKTGVMGDAELANVANKIFPMLSREQQLRLSSILDQLKRT
ncbi:MAG: hypothetical protein RR232_02460 [Clostridia bacterium]